MTRGATWDGMPPAARCAVAPDLVAAHVAGNDPPLIRVRAATRGRCTTEGDERGGAKRRYPFALQPRNRSARLRSTTTADGATRDARASMSYRPTGDDVHAGAFVARHDAPLIGERAVTRRRRAMEGGDEPRSS
jgi:hypothetical protein